MLQRFQLLKPLVCGLSLGLIVLILLPIILNLTGPQLVPFSVGHSIASTFFVILLGVIFIPSALIKAPLALYSGVGYFHGDSRLFASLVILGGIFFIALIKWAIKSQNNWVSISLFALACIFWGAFAMFCTSIVAGGA
jgi:hypothetical protein